MGNLQSFDNVTTTGPSQAVSSGGGGGMSTGVTECQPTSDIPPQSPGTARKEGPDTSVKEIMTDGRDSMVLVKEQNEVRGALDSRHNTESAALNAEIAQLKTSYTAEVVTPSCEGLAAPTPSKAIEPVTPTAAGVAGAAEAAGSVTAAPVDQMPRPDLTSAPVEGVAAVPISIAEPPPAQLDLTSAPVEGAAAAPISIAEPPPPAQLDPKSPADLLLLGDTSGSNTCPSCGVVGIGGLLEPNTGLTYCGGVCYDAADVRPGDKPEPWGSACPSGPGDIAAPSSATLAACISHLPTLMADQIHAAVFHIPAMFPAGAFKKLRTKLNITRRGGRSRHHTGIDRCIWDHPARQDPETGKWINLTKAELEMPVIAQPRVLFTLNPLGYVTFRFNFHHFDRSELDRRGHTCAGRCLLLFALKMG